MRCYCNRGLKRKIAISVSFSPPPRRGFFFVLASQINIQRCVTVPRFSPLFLIALITMCLLEDYFSLSPSDTLVPLFFSPLPVPSRSPSGVGDVHFIQIMRPSSANGMETTVGRSWRSFYSGCSMCVSGGVCPSPGCPLCPPRGAAALITLSG